MMLSCIPEKFFTKSLDDGHIPERKKKDEDASDDFPDGGSRAWLVVLGAMCSFFSTIGLVSSWGVFQGYYKSTVLANASPSAIAWIGGLQYCFIYLPGLFAGRLFDLGYFKIPVGVASVVLCLSTFLVGECTEYWHFLLCQGVASGLACGFIWSPTMSVLGHWFNKRLGAAIGIATVGASAGGTIFPVAARHLIVRVGFPWTMRIFGFILLFTLSVANICLTRRLPPSPVSGAFFKVKVLKYPPFAAYSLSGITVFLGAYAVPTFISTSAQDAGVSEEYSFYLVTIVNASSCIGRLAVGLLVDRFGAINTIAPTSLVAGILTYAWPFARTKATLSVIAALYGVFSGSIMAAYMTPVFQMGAIEDVGARAGMAGTLAAFGDLFGPPVAGAIEPHGYEAMGYYGGSCIVLASALMMLARWLALKSLFHGKY